MKDKKLARKMRRDAAYYMRAAIAAGMAAKIAMVAAPMWTAYLVGDMADSLLRLDEAAVLGQLPLFFLAIFLTVVVAPGIDLLDFIALTQGGFAYEGYLMERFLHLDLLEIQASEAGTLLGRVESDSMTFRYNIWFLCVLPPAIAAVAGALALLMVRSGYHPVFCLAMVLLSALPVIRAARVGKRKAELKKETAQYDEERRSREQELLSSRDFVHGYHLDDYMLRRLEALFTRYMDKTGRARAAMDAKDQTVDFLCTYGVQIGTVLVGAVLISLDKLTLGALLGGFLMLPNINQCCKWGKRLVLEIRGRDASLERMTFFYGQAEEPENAPVPTRIALRDVTFGYPGQDRPVLERVSLDLEAGETLRLSGPNGSGKSTLLSILAGLYPAQAGEIRDGEGNMLSPAALRRGVALCQQSGAIFSGTLGSNLFLPPEREAEGAALLKRLGMEKPMDYSVEAEGLNLSPGERKKLLLARALLREAPFLALDEPLNHLDDRGAEVLVQALRDRRGGVLFISHRDLPLGEVRTVELGGARK